MILSVCLLCVFGTDKLYDYSVNPQKALYVNQALIIVCNMKTLLVKRQLLPVKQTSQSLEILSFSITPTVNMNTHAKTISTFI